MNRREFMKALGVGATLAPRSMAGALGDDKKPPAGKPNIIIVMTDQQRADVCRREGFGLDTTPFLDRLARQGRWFQRAYTSMPACTPARVSLLTGRFPSASRVRTNHNAADATYGRDLIDVLRSQGYATALCGKNHSHLRCNRLDHWFELSHDGGFGENRTAQPHPAHVSIVDIMPTLCEALGQALPVGVQGRSLWPLLTGGDYRAWH